VEARSTTVLHLVLEFRGDRLGVPRVPRADDHEVVGDAQRLDDVQDDDVVALLLMGELGEITGEL